MPTVNDIIKIAKVSQYLVENDIGNGGLYGKGIDLLLPKKIYCVRKNLQRATSDPDITYINAIGYIQVNSIGQVGDSISVYVNDPELSILFLGSYQVTLSDINVNILAQNIANVLGGYGYTISCQDNIISIEARDGIGEDINGDSNLFVQLETAGDYLITENNAIIDTENNNNLIIES